jgi:hypothetical protein
MDEPSALPPPLLYWGPLNGLCEVLGAAGIPRYDLYANRQAWAFACGDWSEQILLELNMHHFRHWSFSEGGFLFHKWVNVDPVDASIIKPGYNLDAWFYGVTLGFYRDQTDICYNILPEEIDKIKSTSSEIWDWVTNLIGLD